MKTGAQTTPLITGCAAGLTLMWVAYGTEAGILGERWSAAVLAAVVIVGVGVWFYVERDAVDMEKAGDGCYYLGLIFTLFSLIVVLSGFAVGPEEVSAAKRTNEVVSKFGVALSSTLAGVAVRIFLQNCAPEDESGGEGFTPERARAIYGDALSLATRRTLRELRNAEASFARIARSALMQAEMMERRAGQAGTQAGENVAEALERMVAGVERVNASIEKLRQETIEQRDQIRAASADTKQHVEETRRSLAQTAEHIKEARNTARELWKASAEVNTEVGKAAGRLQEAGRETATVIKGRADEAVETLQEATLKEARNTARELRKASAEVNTEVGKAAGRLQEAGREAATVIKGRADEAVETLQEATLEAKRDVRGEAQQIMDEMGRQGRNL